MMDLHERLARTLDAMNESQTKRYWEKRAALPNQGRRSIEAQLSLAEKVLGKPITESTRHTEDIRESAPIRRNNGAQGPVSESAGKLEEADAKLFKNMMKPKEFIQWQKQGKVPTAITEAGEQAENDYRFAKLLGLNESDAVRVATEGLCHPGSTATRRRRELLRD